MEEAKLTKQDFLDAIIFIKYKLPEIEHQRIMQEREMRKTNPFYPFRMDNDLKKALIKWCKNEN